MFRWTRSRKCWKSGIGENRNICDSNRNIYMKFAITIAIVTDIDQLMLLILNFDRIYRRLFLRSFMISFTILPNDLSRSRRSLMLSSKRRDSRINLR